MKKIKYFTVFLGVGYLMLVILFLITAAIFAHTNINDEFIDLFVYGSVAISTFISSLLLNRKIKEKGIIYGMIFGILTMSIIYLLSFIFIKDVHITITTLTFLGISIICSSIGGILGVNS